MKDMKQAPVDTIKIGQTKTRIVSCFTSKYYYCTVGTDNYWYFYRWFLFVDINYRVYCGFQVLLISSDENVGTQDCW